MTKTIDGKFIFTHKGENYVPLEDYVKLLQEKENLKEKVILLRASEPMLELEKYYGDRDKYKEVIEEAKEYVNNHIHQETFTGYMDSYELKKLLQILDKVKDKQ